jgi:hypothetical protein
MSEMKPYFDTVLYVYTYAESIYIVYIGSHTIVLSLKDIPVAKTKYIMSRTVFRPTCFGSLYILRDDVTTRIYVCTNFQYVYICVYVHTVEPGYNDIGVYDTSSIPADILRYQLIPRC